MPIHYPNGKPYQAKRQTTGRASRTHAGRGMTLEDEINSSNASYREAGRAVVHKKPTPIQIVRVDYPTRAQTTIREAYFKTPSTTDYNGVYKGYYLDFDAKETKNKTNFPLKNFHEHQVNHLAACLAQDGICFVIIRFVTLERAFVLPASSLIRCWREAEKGARKSIPLETVEKEGFELKPQLLLTVPYLDGVDWLIARKKEGLLNG